VPVEVNVTDCVTNALIGVSPNATAVALTLTAKIDAFSRSMKVLDTLPAFAVIVVS
jgi:hypothetical protein